MDMVGIPLSPLRGSSFFLTPPSPSGLGYVMPRLRRFPVVPHGILDGAKMRSLPNEHGGHSSAAPPGLILLSHHAHPALPDWATLCRAYGASLWFPMAYWTEP